MIEYLFIDDYGRLLDVVSYGSPELAKTEARRLAAKYRADEITICTLTCRVTAVLCPTCGYRLELNNANELCCPVCQSEAGAIQPLQPDRSEAERDMLRRIAVWNKLT